MLKTPGDSAGLRFPRRTAAGNISQKSTTRWPLLSVSLAIRASERHRSLRIRYHVTHRHTHTHARTHAHTHTHNTPVTCQLHEFRLPVDTVTFRGTPGGHSFDFSQRKQPLAVQAVQGNPKHQASPPPPHGRSQKWSGVVGSPIQSQRKKLFRKKRAT